MGRSIPAVRTQWRVSDATDQIYRGPFLRREDAERVCTAMVQAGHEAWVEVRRAGEESFHDAWPASQEQQT